VGTTGKICPEDDDQHVISGILEKGDNLAGSRSKMKDAVESIPELNPKIRKCPRFCQRPTRIRSPKDFVKTFYLPDSEKTELK
jgi:hypothetical protein